jgi:hypothetical protein
LLVSLEIYDCPCPFPKVDREGDCTSQTIDMKKAVIQSDQSFWHLLNESQTKVSARFQGKICHFQFPL